MLRGYLDQNKWIDLARAARRDDRGVRFIDVGEAMDAAALAGTASFPLGSVHYTETWHIRDAKRRTDLALLMTRLSRRQAIAPIGDLIPAEVEQALHRLCGRPRLPMEPVPFGVGMAFACGVHPGDQGPPKPEETTAMAEFFALAAGDQTDLTIAASAERHSASAAHKAAEDRLREDLREGMQKYGPDRTFVTLALQVVEQEWITRSIGNDVPVAVFSDLGPDGFADFLMGIPSVAALTWMRMEKHRNMGHRWDTHDLNDLRALSVAGVYCDVVIAEKQWIDYMHRAKLDARFGTLLLSDLNGLLPLLR